MGWQDEFKIRSDIGVPELYEFEKALNELGGTGIGLIANALHVLRSAVAAGWIESPDAEAGDFEGETRYFLGGENLDKVDPGKVIWYGGEVGRVYSKFLTVPKN